MKKVFLVASLSIFVTLASSMIEFHSAGADWSSQGTTNRYVVQKIWQRHGLLGDHFKILARSGAGSMTVLSVEASPFDLLTLGEGKPFCFHSGSVYQVNENLCPGFQPTRICVNPFRSDTERHCVSFGS